jgi:hypothetical protein
MKGADVLLGFYEMLEVTNDSARWRLSLEHSLFNRDYRAFRESDHAIGVTNISFKQDYRDVSESELLGFRE